MVSRIYSLQPIRYWFCYTIEEVCALYKGQNLHPQTVRQWVRDGLKTTDSGKPVLIYGYDLSTFLAKMNERNKCRTQFDEMFCMSCKDAQPLLKKEIQLEHKKHLLHASGHCRSCKTLMFKSYKLDDLPEIRRKFNVVHNLSLYDSDDSPSQTHIEAQGEHPVSEPCQGSLF